MTCSNCDRELSSSARFCRSCGTKVTLAAPPVVAAPHSPDELETVLMDTSALSIQPEPVVPVAAVLLPPSPVPIPDPPVRRPPLAPPPVAPPQLAPRPAMPPTDRPGRPAPGLPPSVPPPPVGLRTPLPTAAHPGALDQKPVTSASRSFRLATLVGLAVALLSGAAYLVLRPGASQFPKSSATVVVGVLTEGEKRRLAVISSSGTILFSAEASVSDPNRWMASETGFGVVLKNAAGNRIIIENSGRRIDNPEVIPQFDFAEGLAPAREPGGACGYVDRTYRFVNAARFSECGYFSEGLAVVSGDSGLGYADKTGAVVIRQQFAHARPFSENRAYVQTRAGDYHYIDHSGTKLFPGTPTSRLQLGGDPSFHSARAPLEANDRYGYIDLQGTPVIPATLLRADPFHEDRAFIKDSAGVFRMIDPAGRVIPFVGVSPRDADQFENGLAPVEVEGKWGLMDRNGRMVLPASCVAEPQESRGVWLCRDTGGPSYVDSEGAKLNLPGPFCFLVRGLFACVDLPPGRTFQPTEIALMAASDKLPVVLYTRSGKRIGLYSEPDK